MVIYLFDRLNFFVTGEGFIFLLLVGIILETFLIILGNKEYAFDSFGEDEKNITEEVDEYASKALTLASITFAGLTFLLGSFRGQYTLIRDALFVFVFALSLFLLSYKLNVWGPTRRLWWSLQQRFFNYGLLALLIGLCLFFRDTFSEILLLLVIITLIVIIVHFFEYKHDFSDYTKDE